MNSCDLNKNQARAYALTPDGGQPAVAVPVPAPVPAPVPGPRSAQSPHGLSAAPAVPGVQAQALRPRGKRMHGFEPDPVNTPSEPAQQPPDGLTACAATPWSAWANREVTWSPARPRGFGLGASMQHRQLPGQMPDIKPVDIEPVDIEPVDIEPVDIEPVDIEAVLFGGFEVASAQDLQPMMDPAADPWSTWLAGMSPMAGLSPELPLPDEQDVRLDLPPRPASPLSDLVPARPRGGASEADQQPPDALAPASKKRKWVPRLKPSIDEHVIFLEKLQETPNLSRDDPHDYSAFLGYLETGPCLPDGPKISTQTQFKALPLPDQNNLVYAMTDSRKAQMIQVINRVEQRKEGEKLEPKNPCKSRPGRRGPRRPRLSKEKAGWAPIITSEVYGASSSVTLAPTKTPA